MRFYFHEWINKCHTWKVYDKCDVSNMKKAVLFYNLKVQAYKKCYCFYTQTSVKQIHFIWIHERLSLYAVNNEHMGWLIPDYILQNINTSKILLFLNWVFREFNLMRILT